MHNGFVRINSEKMSKSLGNVFSIREILEIWHPEVLRLFILQSHYKNPIDYSNESLAEARAGMERFYAMLKRVDEIFPELKIRPAERGTQADAAAALTGKEREIYDRIMELPEKFAEAMDDDFNTAKALGHIFDLVRLVNGYIAEEGFRATPRAALILRAVKDRMFETGNVLGLFGEDPDRYFIMDRDREALKLGLNVEEIETMIAERSRARTSRDWEKADEIRNALFQKKVFLQDSPTGTTWRIE